MKWNNLKNNRCPREGRYLEVDGRFAKCSCGFIIGLEKLGRIATEQVLADIERRKEEKQQQQEQQSLDNHRQLAEYNDRRYKN